MYMFSITCAIYIFRSPICGINVGKKIYLSKWVDITQMLNLFKNISMIHIYVKCIN